MLFFHCNSPVLDSFITSYALLTKGISTPLLLLKLLLLDVGIV